MIILTSGSVNGMSKTLGEAQKARNSGIKVMVISVGSNNNINQEVIDGMATEPRNKYVFSDDSFDPLRSMRDILAQRKCSGNTLLQSIFKIQNSVYVKTNTLSRYIFTQLYEE